MSVAGRRGRWLTRRRMRALLRHSGPRSVRFRRRIAFLGGAVMVGLVALIFARLADEAGELSARLLTRIPFLMLLLTPAGFALLALTGRRFAPLAGGSGIPQVIAAVRLPATSPLTDRLLDLKAALVKCVLTVVALVIGASVGREGPTVQISAALMAAIHRALRLPIGAATIIAGGAAGVAAAFNTPVAGIAFAIEELATAYEQRTTLLIITAVILSGMMSLGVAGDYLYFGEVTGVLPFAQALWIIPLAGVSGGLAGGLFARLLLGWTFSVHPWVLAARRRPVLTALLCGLGVAVVGYLSGTSWGTGYSPARAALTGSAQMPAAFGPAKFLSTALTAFSGIPGGIFAPSLATGAGVGNILHLLLPGVAAGPVILLGMIGYFAGVVRAPLTAVIIISETTASRSLLLPLMAVALIADGVSALVSRKRLYHGLSERFLKHPAA